MQPIRLLTSVQGMNSPVVGDAGDIVHVPDDVAEVWADGERAERLNLAEFMTAAGVAAQQATEQLQQTIVSLVKQQPKPVVTAPEAPPPAARRGGRQRRTRPVTT